ncbi:MAG: exodeoxyribonuclease VII large subunit, partial [Clostridia bacterium]|nr:exodeoxyribonuclease VII large subunit [Clostridia bacterium]
MDNVISVSQFSVYVKQIFEHEELLHDILIFGEVSGFNVSRGIAYFNIKDEDALLACVKFGVTGLDYLPKDGEMVLVRGSPNYYIKGGRFSFNVTKIEPYGKGLLYQQFLEMKEKLEKAGLFDEKNKKPLPLNIKKIGVVTASTGAVIHDIMDITGRRNPLLDILLYPAKVQGVGAEETIAKGVSVLDKTDVDVIIVARGGGSIEDLSCFNTEVLAYAIYNANKPVISAVGHETDYTICDLVADIRAPTPSAAAELVSVDMGALMDRMNLSMRKLSVSINNKIEDNLLVVSDFFDDIISSTNNIINNK